MIAEKEAKYMQELAKSYPNRNSALSEIINLSAILNLPKGTEHFMSDLHGEHSAFSHIRRNASGVIRRKVDVLFKNTLTTTERAEFSTLIYYPEEKIDMMLEEGTFEDDWCKITLGRLIEVCRFISSKYTRSKIRKHLSRTARGYDYIIDELLYNDYDALNKGDYYENILNTIISVGVADKLIVALCSAIKSMIIDHLHIVGDIFDRGPRADLIMEQLMRESSIDIQWGNHDVLWMGAAAGSRVCIATVLNNSITYKNLDVVEIGYGISLRPLSLFANDVYANSDITCFMPKGNSSGDIYIKDDDRLVARMHKAISVIQFKLEGQTIMRNPEFDMESRMMLSKIDFNEKTITIDGKKYTLRDSDLPTVDPENPYKLTDGEYQIMTYLKNAFMRSEKLQSHIRFLYEKGEIYTVFNKNLLFHGCIPLNDDGSFMSFPLADGKKGKEFMDYCDRTARKGFFAREGSQAKQHGKDFLWFLWTGKNSPLAARKKTTPFERLFIEDQKTWEEPKNAYYRCWDDEGIVQKILEEFGLGGEHSHIINGHIPVKYKKGEKPIKANGKLVLIDGGFCHAYQKTTGIAGYTLIYNADGMRISAHEPFRGIENAIKSNTDIISETVVFERASDKIRVKDTDIGEGIRGKISDLTELVECYETGVIKEKIYQRNRR